MLSSDFVLSGQHFETKINSMYREIKYGKAANPKFDIEIIASFA